MSTVIMHNVVSVDGFIADDERRRRAAARVVLQRRHAARRGRRASRSREASADYVRPMWEASARS